MSLTFNSKINQIKDKINIVEVIGKFLNLTSKGNNFWAICPFHADSTPSLSVSKEKQIYKCFSCGEQGNVFIFLQKYKNITFIEALKEATAITNIDLTEFEINLTDSVKKLENPLKNINKLVMNFYNYQLLTIDGQKALKYLESRNITEENIKEFNIGYAPFQNKLLEYLQAQNISETTLINLGLLKINKRDQIVDTFVNRIIFPIKDEEGECIGFSARAYDSSESSFKYINSPESEIFHKSQILYNLNNINKTLKTTDSIYLVEGYMDVISLWNQNIKNVVALMGTNLTKEHLNILKKINQKIIIFLDGDLPGKHASLKIASLLLKNNFLVQIINNTTDLDPDELVNKKIEKFNEIVTKSVHPFQFAIDFYLAQYDINNDSYQLTAFVKALVPIWETINDSISKKFYFNKLLEITNLETKQLTNILKLNEVIKKNNFNLNIKNKYLEAQKQLLFLVLLSRETFELLETQKFIFPISDYMNLYFLISQKYQNILIKQIDFAEILEELQENHLLKILEEIINEYKMKKFEVKPIIINDYIKIINNCLIENKIQILNDKIRYETEIENKIKLLKEISLLKLKLK